MTSTGNENPIAASQALNPEIRQRRERGRAAQAAFRKRQIDTIQRQQEQLCSFNDAFKAVSQACNKLKLAVKMSAAMGNGDLPAYIGNDILDQIEQAIGKIPGPGPIGTESIVRVSDDSALSKSGNLSTDAASSECPRTLANLYPSQVSRASTSYQSVVQPHKTRAPTNTDQSSSMSLTSVKKTSFWDVPVDLDMTSPSIVVCMTPIDLVPYMAHAQHAQHTFAGRLFWSTLSVAFQMTNGMREKEVVRSKGMFRYYDQGFVMDHIRKRLAIKLVTNSTGVIEKDTAPEMVSYMTELVTKGMAAEGEQIQDYLDPREVELYLRRKYIDPNHLDLVAGAHETCDQGLADRLASSLIQKISQHALCFGDAPRYHVRDIERACEVVMDSSRCFSQRTQPSSADCEGNEAFG